MAVGNTISRLHVEGTDDQHSIIHLSRLYGAEFAPQDQIKATLHTWLAWQKEPGLPYGTAIKAKYFGNNSPVAMDFVSWFKILFAIK